MSEADQRTVWCPKTIVTLAVISNFFGCSAVAHYYAMAVTVAVVSMRLMWVKATYCRFVIRHMQFWSGLRLGSLTTHNIRQLL